MKISPFPSDLVQQSLLYRPEFSKNNGKKKAIIIGAGLAGTSTAFSLASRGWDVTILEKEQGAAQAASGNMAGVFMPMITSAGDPIGTFYLEAFYYAVQHFEVLRSLCKKTLLWGQCGVLDMTPKKVAKDTKKLVMSLELIAKVNEKLASKFASIPIHSRAMYLPDAGWINPPSICEAQLRSYEGSITFKTNENIHKLKRNNINNLWQVIDKSKNIVDESDVVVLANARDALHFSVCDWLPLQCVRGQTTYLPESEYTKNLSTVLCANGYMTPAINGFHCLGATFNREDSRTDISPADHEENIENIRQYIDIPKVSYTELEGRVGFRTATPDRRPVIGAMPKKDALENVTPESLSTGNTEDLFHKGLYVSLGHGSRGITSAPIAGEYLAELIDPASKKKRRFVLDDDIAAIVNPLRFLFKKQKEEALKASA
jgi:tRNA 5-methylaminomethyl-2-thiouridine biosynthesis bifunctional protein